MAARTNRQILLADRPRGPLREDCFRSVETPAPEPAEGEALVRVLYLSLDPTIKGWMERDTYLPAIGIGEVIRSGGVAEVVASRTPAYRVGDRVFGMTGWQDYALAGPGAMTVLPQGVSPVDAIGVYGITGMTAYFGLLDVGRPEPGETVVVSGAAGATGSVVGQIAKLKGCRAIGIAGGDAKCRWVTEDLGFDACIDYKAEKVGERLRATCPDGIDVYFDNVGGEILQTVLEQINRRARVVLCGAISTYEEATPPPGPNNLMQLIIQRARMEGFLVLDYFGRFPEAMAEMSGWVAEGKLRHRETVVDGLENAPSAMKQLFTGGNVGKLMVKVA